MATVQVIGPMEPLDPTWTEARSAAEVERHAAAGRTVAVTLSGDETTQIAAAAVLAWLGARVFRTPYQAPVRQAIDMAESLAGRRPPSLTRRGLA
ncbi:hypothetical protein DQ384_38950 [Sphaerisporangium album]|uniref:LLM class flavin-dependent oxidoreductase n=1 Tax=Sphaerisporangium album TaxID=509200 RepID=A0A367ELQ0_9ACTN|nr:hypothetical protein [Sphaerisporangium album]RCG18679.1 hypothetical protein DQ384_38950 [Sphaerisporangium album]